MLEDDFTDIIAKAAHGLGISVERPTPENYLESATKLGLNEKKLELIANSQYLPTVTPPGVLTVINAGTLGFDVNSFLLADPDTHETLIVDTGLRSSKIIQTIEAYKLNPTALLITHGHRDHVFGLKKLQEAFPNIKTYADEREKIPNAVALKHGDVVPWNSTQIEVRSTPGHSVGGLTFVVKLAGAQIGFVGDALFAGSVGRIRQEAYKPALEAVEKEILGLPEETILCPGHGPITTVALEKAHNPFF